MCKSVKRSKSFNLLCNNSKLHKNYFEICENLNKDNQVNQFNQDNVDNQKNEDKLNKNFTFSQDYKPETKIEEENLNIKKDNIDTNMQVAKDIKNLHKNRIISISSVNSESNESKESNEKSKNYENINRKFKKEINSNYNNYNDEKVRTLRIMHKLVLKDDDQPDLERKEEVNRYTTIKTNYNRNSNNNSNNPNYNDDSEKSHKFFNLDNILNIRITKGKTKSKTIKENKTTGANLSKTNNISNISNISNVSNINELIDTNNISHNNSNINSNQNINNISDSNILLLKVNNDKSSFLISNKDSNNINISKKTENINSINELGLTLNNKPFCRICLEEEDNVENKLISPCPCKGSSKHVHGSCLKQFFYSKENYQISIQDLYDKVNMKCDICQYVFALIPVLESKCSSEKIQVVVKSVMIWIFIVTVVFLVGIFLLYANAFKYLLNNN